MIDLTTPAADVAAPATPRMIDFGRDGKVSFQLPVLGDEGVPVGIMSAFAMFYDRYHDDTLVLDKWFALQAAAQRADTVSVVEALASHPDFTLKNPNRWRALVSNFAANQWAFHHASGRGYRFVAPGDEA